MFFVLILGPLFVLDSVIVEFNLLQCSTSCGQGIQLREVFCKVNAPTRGLIIVDDSNCKAVERPEKELICNVHNPCPGDG